MKILFNIKSLTNKGGAERALLALAGEMARRGHEIHITARDRPGTQFAYPIPEGVHVTCLGSRRAPLLKGLIRSHQSRFNAYVAKNRYDLIIGWLRHGGAMVGWLPPGTPAVRVAAMRNLPYNMEPPYRRPLRLLKFYHRKSGFGRADHIFVQMPQFLDLMPPAWRQKAVVIPNAAAVPDHAPEPEGEKEKLVIAVSRIVEQKRLDTLVRAFALFRRSHPDWRLEIWGQGKPAQRQTLQKEIDRLGLGESAKLMGITNDIEAVYRRARIFAHPSRREGMSNAVVEAMAHDVPVIACGDCHGMCELVHDGSTGLLVEGRQGARPLEEQLCEAMESLADKPKLAERLAEGARQHLASRYAPDVIFDRWEETLVKLNSRT